VSVALFMLPQLAELYVSSRDFPNVISTLYHVLELHPFHLFYRELWNGSTSSHDRIMSKTTLEDSHVLSLLEKMIRCAKLGRRFSHSGLPN
jgi:hypothetical protein